MKKGDVACTKGDPLVRLGKVEREPRPRVPAKSAIDRDQAVARELAPRPGSQRPGDGIAFHAGRERERSACVDRGGKSVSPFPVLVEHTSEAQVGDARAADLSKPRKRGAISADPQEKIDPA